MKTSGVLDQLSKVLQQQLEQQQKLMKKQTAGADALLMSQKLTATDQLEKAGGAAENFVSNLFAKDAVQVSDSVKAMLAQYKAQQNINASQSANASSLIDSVSVLTDFESSHSETQGAVQQVVKDAGVRDVDQIKREMNNKLSEDQSERATNEQQLVDRVVSSSGGVSTSTIRVPRVGVKMTKVKAPSIRLVV